MGAVSLMVDLGFLSCLTGLARVAIISLLNSTSVCNFGLMRPKLLKLLALGESPRDERFDAVELAAWTGAVQPAPKS